MMAEKKGDYAAAVKHSRKAIEIYPEGYSYYETLGKAFFGLEEYEKSIYQFNYLLKNNKRLTDYYTAYYHLWIGKSCLKLNEIDWAREEFQKVKEFNIEDLNREIDLLLKDNPL
jgi:tetratricopeptide (TPR) repeat protein